MKKFLSLILTALLSSSFCACSGSSTQTLNVYNWGDYIGEGVIEKFEAEHPGVKVNYELFDSNESMHNKVSNNAGVYDVIFPSDYMIERMISQGELEPIAFENIENYEKYITDNFKNLDYDPENMYSVPYTFGTVGILYNKKMVDGVPSFKTLWDKKYENNVIMYDSERDSIGITLKMLGYSLNSESDAELLKAKEQLIAQSPNVQAYFTDLVREKMVAGDAALAVVYSGDASLCIAENPDLAFVIPEEGSNIFYDAMCIPKGSKNKALAEEFINFMLREDIARENAKMGYCMPHSAIYEDVEFRNEYAIYPSEEAAANCEFYHNLSDESNAKYADIWTEVKLMVH